MLCPSHDNRVLVCRHCCFIPGAWLYVDCFLKLFPLYQDDLLVKEGFKTFLEAHKEDLGNMTKVEMSSHLSKFLR